MSFSDFFMNNLFPLEPPLPEAASQSKLVAVMCIVSLVDLCLLSFACYLVLKIYHLVKFTDKPMLLSIASIALALACFLVYSILLIV